MGVCVRGERGINKRAELMSKWREREQDINEIRWLKMTERCG